MIVEISTHGSTLKRDHDCFLIQSKDEKTEIPAEKVDAIIITSNALVSTQAIKLCLEKQIQLVISEWSGKPVARMWVSTPGKATEIRRNQYLNLETQIGFDICKEIVTIKLKRQKKLLNDLKNNRKHTVLQIDSAISVIYSSLKKIDSVLMDSNWKATLLGLEGISAAQYFRAISASLPKRWAFKERSQHPALDEFNTALNYIYGMGYSSVEKIIILSGLDPNGGFYHSDSYAKPTLSFDIIEMVRPLMDRTIVSLFNKRLVRENWFENQMGEGNCGIFLTKDGRKSLISSYVENNIKTIESESWNYCKKLIQKLTTGDSVT